MKKYLNGMEVRLNSTVDNNSILEPGQSMNLTRIIQEALNNSRKYSNATLFEIECSQKKQSLEIKISDNGNGMVVDEEVDKGNGLKNMAYRAMEMGGGFQITSDEGIGVEIHLNFEVKIP